MSDLFHFLAADDEHDARQRRVATAVAHKRVKDQFGSFLSNATDSDRSARLSLVEDDIRSAIASVGEEYGVDTDKIEDAIIRNLAGGNADHLKDYQFKPKGDDDKDAEDEVEDYSEEANAGELEKEVEEENPKSASVKEARRPKMCPYHSEVVDISLGTGDPQAGYNSLSNQAWGNKHCKGGFDGTCNFKPQMVTQKYWDDKREEYRQRADEREQKLFEDIPSLDGTEPVMTAEPLPDEEGQGVTDINTELESAPSAVGEMALAHTAADAPEGLGGAVKRESLPKADESGLGGPSPKIDKSKSGDERGWTLDEIDTEMSGTHNPTITQDPTDKAKFDKRDFLDQADTKIKQVELDTAGDWEAGFADGGETHEEGPFTWTEDNGANPITRSNPEGVVSSYDDNPLREIIETNFGGFLPASDIDAAISDFE